MGSTALIRRHGTKAAVLVLLVLAAMVALNRLDLALAGAHTPSTASGGVGDIASASRILSPDVSFNVAEGWLAYDRRVPAPTVPARAVETLTYAYLVWDLVLMASLTWLLFLVRNTLSPVPEPQQGDRLRPAFTVLRLSQVPILAYLIFDSLETVGATVGWEAIADGMTWVAVLVGMASAAKWLSLAAALLAMCVWLAYDRKERIRSTRVAPPTKALRGQILVAAFVVLFLIGLQGDLGRQIDDVLVRAADSIWPALLATGLMLATWKALLTGGSQCLHAFDQEPEIVPMSRKVVIVALATVGVLGALAGVAAAVGATAVWRSLVVPAGCIAAWLILSIPSVVHNFVPVASPPDLVGTSGRGAAPASRLGWTGQPTTGDEDSLTGTRLLLAGLAATPAVALYLATVAAATSQFAGYGVPGLLSVWAVVLLLLSCMVLLRGISISTSPWNWAPGRLTSLLGVCLLALLGLALLPTALWMWVGSPGVVFLFTTVLAIIVALLVLLSDAVAPRGALALAGFKRVPFIMMILLWGLIASILDDKGEYYDARVTTTQTAAAAQAPEAAYNQWVQAQQLTPGADVGDSATVNGRRVVPLVFVASAGGGIRAAYWTAKTWDCVFATACENSQDHSADVFFASGVSGGAVGLAQVRAHQLAVSSDDATTKASTTSTSWVDAALGDDFLAPAVASFVFRDLPNSLTRFPFHGLDRSASLELALEAANEEMDSVFPSHGLPFPRLAFSGTSVEDGCRLSISDVNQAAGREDANCMGVDTSLPEAEGPGSTPVRDAAGYVCDEGEPASLRLSTAAVLSARFPVVSPAGGLGPCGKGAATYSVDGGLFDNSAGSAVTATWKAVADKVAETNAGKGICAIPRLVVMDSHYSSLGATDPASRPLQSAAPLGALLNVYGQRNSRALAEATRVIEAAAREEAKACGDASLAVGSVVQIFPRASTAPQPPLGWALAKSTRDNLTAQLFTGCKDEPTAESPASGSAADSEAIDNCAAVVQVRSWFGES